MSERYVTLAEVNELLEQENLRRQDTENEFNGIQKSAMEHAQKYAVLSKEKADELMAEIRELNEKRGGDYVIPEYLICKIADILPKYMNDVRAIFYKERGVNVEEDGLGAAIIEIVSKYI
jgi:DNA-directed RNA polymerase subunit F